MKQQKLLEKEVSITGSNECLRDPLDRHQRDNFYSFSTKAVQGSVWSSQYLIFSTAKELV